MKVTVSVGGTWTAFRLAEQLDRRGFLHRLVTTHRPLRGEQVDPRRLLVNPVPEILMRGPRRLGLRWAIGDYLKAVAFDRWAARHVSGCDLLAVWALFALRSLRVARAHGARTILERGSTHVRTQWNLVAEEHRRWGASEPPMDRRLFDRQLAEYDEADYIEVTSRFVLESFLEHGVPRERLLLVHNLGIDHTLFHPRPVAAGAAPDGPFVVLAVGAGLRKGTPYLLDAVARMRVPALELWLAGAVPPDLAPAFRRFDVRFRHLGTLSHRQLAEVYRAASVFILPSIEEGLAMAVLEAMASGLPVVVTPNTGAEDLITHGREGLIVPLRDPSALRRALLELYEDPSRRLAMGEAAARAAAAWTWEAYGTRAVDAYTRLLSPSHAPASPRGDRPAGSRTAALPGDG